jgi:hypothetical protein
MLLLLIVERLQQCSVVERTLTNRQSRALLYRFTESVSAPTAITLSDKCMRVLEWQPSAYTL